MRLKNILFVVEDVEKSVEFYKELFGLQIVSQFDGNVILTEGLVLQERKGWEELTEHKVTYGNHDSELFFVENDMDNFLGHLKKTRFGIEYVQPIMEHSWGQRVVRIYDPDHHVLEISEELEGVVRKFLNQGMTLEMIAVKMELPLEYIKDLIGQ